MTRVCDGKSTNGRFAALANIRWRSVVRQSKEERHRPHRRCAIIVDMASRSVKFEISLKELTVKFEGDIQTAERMHSQITGAINSLASAQNRLISSSPQATVSPSIEVAPGRRRRRRTRKVEGIDPSILEADVVSGNGTEGESAAGNADSSPLSRRPRRSGGAQTELLTRLKSEGFFSERRTIGDIREALSRKGHTFKSNELSPILIALTKQEILRRERGGDDQWLYFSA